MKDIIDRNLPRYLTIAYALIGKRIYLGIVEVLQNVNCILYATRNKGININNESLKTF